MKCAVCDVFLQTGNRHGPLPPDLFPSYGLLSIYSIIFMVHLSTVVLFTVHYSTVVISIVLSIDCRLSSIV